MAESLIDLSSFPRPALSFHSQHGRHLATVIKYNRKTVTVVDDQGRQWRVTPGLLSPVKDVDVSAAETTPRPDRNRLR